MDCVFPELLMRSFGIGVAIRHSMLFGKELAQELPSVQTLEDLYAFILCGMGIAGWGMYKRVSRQERIAKLTEGIAAYDHASTDTPSARTIQTQESAVQLTPTYD